MLPRKPLCFVLPVLMSLQCGQTARAQAPNTAEWSILLYMNGNNSLEPDAEANFEQIASVGSSDKLNIVVEIGRLTKRNVLRGRVAKGRKPESLSKLIPLGNLDMGSPGTFDDFIRWGITAFPARKYMVVVWNHGQGWRNAVAPDEVSLTTDQIVARPASPFRAISFDELHHSQLYNKDVQLVLEKASLDAAGQGGLAGQKFDVLAFDACLMAMVETSYAFRKSASIMVASEELVPGLGFRYDKWLGLLAENPKSDGPETAKFIVSTYETAYKVSDTKTTLSAVDVGRAIEVAKESSSFATALSNSLPAQRAAISNARHACPTYGFDAAIDARKSLFYHIDLQCFSGKMVLSHNHEVSAAASKVVSSIKNAVVYNYVGSGSKPFVSAGLAIYFPETLNEYSKDVYADKGYDKTNTLAPVDFVNDFAWSDFLKKYLSPAH